MPPSLPGVIASPNIWRNPAVYELTNEALDREQVIDAAMTAHHDWADLVVLDVGCGAGFHLPRLARRARQVIGVEPHEPLLRAAANRVRALDPAVRSRIRLLPGTAQALPVPDASVDVVQARWAYFFGPGCEPGLAELRRVLRRSGTAFVIDVDATRSTFGRWFRDAWPRYDPVAVERFWARQGWSRQSVEVRWSFDVRTDLEAAVLIEFPEPAARAALAGHQGTSVDYAVNLRWRTF